MKPRLLARTTTLAVIAAIPFVFAVFANADETALEAVRAKMSAMFQAIEPENVIESPIDGWFTIQQGSIVAYVSEDGRYLLQGDLIDLDTQVNLTEQSRNSARRDLVATLAADQTIDFSPAAIKYSVTVFTDVDCTYCRKLHSQIDEYTEEGIEVRYLLYPRNGPTSKSWGIAENVWCAKDRNHALTAAKLDRDFESSECDASAVQAQYDLGRDVGVSGTPTIVLQDGSLIGGYMPPAQLAQRLQLNAAQ